LVKGVPVVSHPNFSDNHRQNLQSIHLPPNQGILKMIQRLGVLTVFCHLVLPTGF
jgi:hypothetical protein